MEPQKSLNFPESPPSPGKVMRRMELSSNYLGNCEVGSLVSELHHVRQHRDEGCTDQMVREPEKLPKVFRDEDPVRTGYGFKITNKNLKWERERKTNA